MSLLKVENLVKVYSTLFGKVNTIALKNLSLEINEGEFVAIMGESGSGKSTLLNIIALIDTPSEGVVYLNDKAINYKKTDLASFRRKNIGFVFQDFSLQDTLSAKDNIALPLVLSGYGVKEIEEKISKLAKSLKIDNLLEKYPYEMSGGQQQRVAIARAVVNDPKIILADEPTGALDTKLSKEMMQCFDNLNKEGKTILMVTHSILTASYANRVLFIKDGTIYNQLYRGDKTNQEMQKAISDSINIMSISGDENVQ